MLLFFQMWKCLSDKTKRKIELYIIIINHLRIEWYKKEENNKQMDECDYILKKIATRLIQEKSFTVSYLKC